jgi:hypothetical protein
VPGNLLPTVSGLDLEGQIQSIHHPSRDGKSTVVLVFSPFCGWCEINLPNWKAIISQSGGRYRVVGVSIVSEGVAGYAAKNGLDHLEVIVEMDPGGELLSKLQTTPQTVLIGPDGRVRRNWVGAFDLEDRVEVEHDLGIHLPDSYFDSIGWQIGAGRRNDEKQKGDQ